MKKTDLKISTIFIALIFVLLLGMLLSLSFGSEHIKLATIWNVLISQDENIDSIIVNALRVPRALLAALIGANLSVAGALMQCLTRNPLAEPKMMGVSGGASFIFVIATFFQLPISQNILTFLVFIGAALGGTLVYIISLYKNPSIGKLVLAGVSVSGFFYALTAGMLILLGEDAGAIYSWLAGGLAGVSWDHFYQILPWSIAALIFSFVITHYMNAYALGDEIAKSLGVNLFKIRIVLCLLVVILTGCAVCVSGVIGFLGLIVPHIVRRAFSDNFKIMLPFTALIGAILLVFSDLIARIIFMPIETPVGVITAFVGCPFFLYLIRKNSEKVV
ncbi:FecCD family ABC transporter permease [Fluviispira multicolorata]|uniref:Iron chelate uptake ABC transporter family permease subunit n=1 Tax=Fluviispira multicolorata TaxID=2654512 RepID=A0A833N4S5_9BACT|nr:iron ABC transporter permease [Fluviispira multicolorata]KAB8033157.1 iron chelate uptake ABC transporter family permease subunit [Fluviispira multicolorata]